VKLEDGCAVELAEGVIREDLDQMITDEDGLDEDGSHYLIDWDDVRDVFAQP
jgi:hypothetical protein